MTNPKDHATNVGVETSRSAKFAATNQTVPAGRDHVQHKAVPGPTVQPANWRDKLAEIRDQLEEGDDHE